VALCVLHMQETKLLGTTAAARLAGCSSEAIRKWANAGVLQVAMRTGFGHRLFDPSEVQRVARERVQLRPADLSLGSVATAVSSGKRWELDIAIDESRFGTKAELSAHANIPTYRLARIIAGQVDPTPDERRRIGQLLGRRDDELLFAKGRPVHRSPDGAAA
jgi:DNA-binding transcriptional MerR regulator